MAPIKLRTVDGSPVEFNRDMIDQGAMKDVYASPDRSYVSRLLSRKARPYWP